VKADIYFLTKLLKSTWRFHSLFDYSTGNYLSLFLLAISITKGLKSRSVGAISTPSKAFFLSFV